MRPPLIVFLASTFALLNVLGAQQVVRLVHGSRPGGEMGRACRAAGDVDGDGVPDMLICEPASATGATGPGRVYLVSGADGATLRTFSPTFAFDATGVADVDNDGRRDIAISTSSGAAQVFSGATGQLLFNIAGGSVNALMLVDVGDLNGDGRGDIAAMISGSFGGIRLFSGSNGAVLGSLALQPGALVGIRDVNGDGRTDLLVGGGPNLIQVVTTNPLRIAASASAPSGGTLGREFTAADVDGDGIDEILAHGFFPNSQGEGIYAFSAQTGLVVRSFVDPLVRLGGAIARIGDLDADGADEFAAPQFELANDQGGRIVVINGRTGATIGILPCDALAPAVATTLDPPCFSGLGDIDHDGFGDFVAGFISGYDGFRGGYRVISGRLVADVVSKGGSCGYGPFPVALGCTRPILGLTAQIVCRDGPSGVLGTLAMSLQPALPRYLGVSTCTAAVGDEWSAVFTTIAPTWSLAVSVPPVPSLAGLQVALQAFYGPTNGPLGIDLSNGLWAKVGY